MPVVRKQWLKAQNYTKNSPKKLPPCFPENRPVIVQVLPVKLPFFCFKKGNRLRHLANITPWFFWLPPCFPENRGGNFLLLCQTITGWHCVWVSWATMTSIWCAIRKEIETVPGVFYFHFKDIKLCWQLRHMCSQWGLNVSNLSSLKSVQNTHY